MPRAQVLASFLASSLLPLLLLRAALVVAQTPAFAAPRPDRAAAVAPERADVSGQPGMELMRGHTGSFLRSGAPVRVTGETLAVPVRGPAGPPTSDRRPPAPRPSPGAKPGARPPVPGPNLERDEPWPAQSLASLRITAAVPGDGALVVELDVDAGTLSVVEQPGHPLGDVARQAISVAPAWVQGSLARNLGELPPEVQDSFAALLLDAPDPRYLDELAFCLAHIAPEDLQREGMSPELLLQNVQQ